MLNEQEKAFVDYWEANRLIEKKFVRQLLAGIPMGFLFSLPVFLILYSGRFWYKRADMVANTRLNPVVLIIAIFLITVFIAVFYKRQQWDRKEQQYLELKAKETADK